MPENNQCDKDPISPNTGDLIFTVDAAQTVTSTDVISGCSVVKLGTGNLVLSGNNTYSGYTEINSGNVVVNNSNALGIGATLIMNSGVLNLNGYSVSVGSLKGSSAGSITNDSSSDSTSILTVNSSSNSTFSGVITDNSSNYNEKVGLIKSGSGSLTLEGVNLYTEPTSVAGGTLVVNGTIQTDVSIESGAFLSGSGTIGDGTEAYNGTTGVLSGDGTISPGDITGTPGILTAHAFDPTEGLGAAFEFTATGDPDFTAAANSVNDVLSLATKDTDPFVGSLLTADNAIDIYFNVDSILPDTTFNGGFFVNFGFGGYTDAPGLVAGVQNATYTYWLKATGSGTRTFNGINYDQIGAEAISLGAVAANEYAGFLTTFTIISVPTIIVTIGTKQTTTTTTTTTTATTTPTPPPVAGGSSGADRSTTTTPPAPIVTTTTPTTTTTTPTTTTTTPPVIYKFRNCCETDNKTFSSPIFYEVTNTGPRSVSLEVGRVFSAKIPSDAAPACFIITEKFSSSGSPPTYSSVTIIEPYDNCDSCAVIVGSCTPPTTIPLRPSAPTPTVATSCWCGLECLQTLENYDKTKTQALIHKEYAKDQSNKFIIRDGVTLDGCLSWENIVECSTPATPLPS